ncbi:hypothetical protein [Streptomyces sp. NPDC054849]
MTVMVEDNNARTPARTDLSDLLRDRRVELRRSLRQVEERTGLREDGTPVIKRSTLDNLEKAVPRMSWTPRLPELQALARAYELPLARVQDAAGAQFMGIDSVWSSSGRARALVQNAEKLTPRQLELLEELAETFANEGPDGTSVTQE